MEVKLSQEILRYRAVHNISQGEMANRCNVTKQTIFNIEHEIQDPTKLTTAKIRLVLDAGKGGDE